MECAAPFNAASKVAVSAAPMPRAGHGRFSGVLASHAAAFRDRWEVVDIIAFVDTGDTIRSLLCHVTGSPLSTFEECTA